MDGAAAGRAYLAAVDALNAVICGQTPTTDLAIAQTRELATADALRVFADAVRKIQMPANLTDDQQDLLRTVAAAEQAERFLASSTTLDEYNARLTAANARGQEGAAISNFIRGELGLESTGGAC